MLRAAARFSAANEERFLFVEPLAVCSSKRKAAVAAFGGCKRRPPCSSTIRQHALSESVLGLGPPSELNSAENLTVSGSSCEVPFAGQKSTITTSFWLCVRIKTAAFFSSSIWALTCPARCRHPWRIWLESANTDGWAVDKTRGLVVSSVFS